MTRAVAGRPGDDLLAVGLAALGILVSVFAQSNRLSLSVSLFLLLALFAPTQLPSSALHGWTGDLLLRLNPITAGEHYVDTIVVGGHPWRDDVSWLTSPAAAAMLSAAAVLSGRVLRLGGGHTDDASSGDGRGSSCCALLLTAPVAAQSSGPMMSDVSGTGLSSGRLSRTAARRRWAG